MIDLVVFRPGQTPLDPVAWAAFSDGAVGDAGRVADVASLVAIADRWPADARLVAVLPGEQIAMRELVAPPRQSAKLHAAAAYLLEDELAQPIEDLHIVVSAGEPRVAFAIAKATMEMWLGAFDGASIALSEVCADFACIAGSPATAVLVADRDRLIASRGVAGFAAEIGLAEMVAPAFLRAAGDAAIIAYGAHDAVGGWTEAPVDRRPLAHEADLLVLFGAALTAKAAPTNLLAGAYRRRSPRAFRFGAYKRPAALAASLAALAVVSAAAAGLRDARVAAIYEESARTMHKTAFPTFDGADIRGHSRQILADGVKSASFLDLAARLDAGLESHDGVAIDRIRYDGARGQFIFSIRSDSDAGIERFREALDAQGLVATDSGGYRRAGDAWIGEMSARAK